MGNPGGRFQQYYWCGKMLAPSCLSDGAGHLDTPLKEVREGGLEDEDSREPRAAAQDMYVGRWGVGMGQQRRPCLLLPDPPVNNESASPSRDQTTAAGSFEPEI